MNKKQPYVSIGMPVYNGESFLKDALDSVLAQTYSNFELIISDNGSTDRTEEICRAYARRDSRIHYYRKEKNRGAGWNQSRVVELSRGKYFKWAHHDDLCAPELLEKCLQILNDHPSAVLCYPKTVVIDERGEPLEKSSDGFNLLSSKPHRRFKRYHQLVRYGNECHPFHGLIRTDILKKTALVGGYPSSDLILLGELVLHGEFYELQEYLFFKRDHPNTSVRAHNAYRERIAWYDPAKKGKLHLTRWKWFFEYLRAIRCVPISRHERVRCYLQMVQWISWNWVWLLKDLVKAASWPAIKLFLNFEPSRIGRKVPIS